MLQMLSAVCGLRKHCASPRYRFRSNSRLRAKVSEFFVKVVVHLARKRRLGEKTSRDATTDVSNADLGTEDVDGIVGTDLLRSYELWFDYRANAVLLRRAQR